MKIRVTTTRGVWVDGQAREEGYVAEVDEASAEAMIANGFAVEVKPRGKRTAQGDTDDE